MVEVGKVDVEKLNKSQKLNIADATITKVTSR
jgi:hypothetical protein